MNQNSVKIKAYIEKLVAEYIEDYMKDLTEQMETLNLNQEALQKSCKNLADGIADIKSKTERIEDASAIELEETEY